MRTRSWLIVGLVLVNVALAGALATRGWRDSTAYAQGRSRIDPIAVSASLNGQLIIYTLDVTTGQLTATKVDVGGNGGATSAATPTNVETNLQAAFKTR
ncbi:MAG: hypothetical protein WCI73_09170 [Phycisphaerae bacterium]